MFNIPIKQVLSVGIDAFGFSWEERYDLFIGGTIQAWADEQSKAGFPRKVGGANGYKGWRCAGVVYGTSAQGGFCEAKGDNAARLFQALQGTPGLRCCRIDIQATVELCKVEQRLAHQCNQAVKAAAAAGLPNVPRKTPLYGDDGEGWTVYLGAPSSDKRARIYDKGAEQGVDDIGRYWRIEYQLRRAYAKETYKSLCGRGSVVDFISGQISRWLEAVGIVVDIGGFSGDSIVVGRRSATDDQKTMDWIREGVAPSVFRLAQGAYREELRALITSWALAVELLEPGDICTEY